MFRGRVAIRGVWQEEFAGEQSIWAVIEGNRKAKQPIISGATTIALQLIRNQSTITTLKLPNIQETQLPIYYKRFIIETEQPSHSITTIVII